jgi:uncharacterized protein YcfJ
MRRLLLVSLLATSAIGLHAETYFDTARVRTVEPQYENVSVPRQECSRQWVNEVRPVSTGSQYGGAIIGGVAGALVGNQVGKGHGREAATALGAVVGALGGQALANRDVGPQYQDVPREVTTCRTVNDVQSRINGYRVGYEYRGQAYSTVLRDNPGPALQVRVSVDPVVQ